MVGVFRRRASEGVQRFCQTVRLASQLLHEAKQTVIEDLLSAVCQREPHSMRGSLIFADDDGLLGADRVLAPSGTEI